MIPLFIQKQRPRRDSNPQPFDPQSKALSIEPRDHIKIFIKYLDKNIIDLDKGLTKIYFEPNNSDLIEDVKLLKSFFVKLFIERLNNLNNTDKNAENNE